MSTGRRHHLQIGDSQENGMNHRRRMARSAMVGRVVNTVSPNHQFFCKSLAHWYFCGTFRVQTLTNVVHATEEVKTAHLVLLAERVAQTQFFSCTLDQRTCVGSRPNSQGNVDRLSRASLSSVFFFSRDSFGAAVFVFYFSLSLSKCDTLPTLHRAQMSHVKKKEII